MLVTYTDLHSCLYHQRVELGRADRVRSRVRVDQETVSTLSAVNNSYIDLDFQIIRLIRIIKRLSTWRSTWQSTTYYKPTIGDNAPKS